MGRPRSYNVWCRKCKRAIKWARGQQQWYHEWTEAERICGRAEPEE